MFKLDVDMALYFVEPMNKHGGGICVTQRFELPFVPFPSLRLNGLSLNDAEIAMGYEIEEITWDVDREAFFGHTSTMISGLPMAFIPMELCSWLDRGWRFGSYEDSYSKPDGRSERVQRKPILCEWDWSDDDESFDKWPQMSPRLRPKSFNDLMKAIVREMSLLHNNTEVAYAMAKTKRYFTGTQLQANNEGPAKKFRDAQVAFARMSFDQQYAWEQSVIRRYPRLEQFLV